MKVEYEPVYVQFVPKELEANKVYISEEYGVAIHNCLCGCGERVVLPINWDIGTAWNLIKENDGKVSFTPSIGNFQIPCKSHYIMTKNVANFV